MPAADRFDPVKFEVIRNALVETTEEMTIALRRSAYSTNIKTRADFSCALFDSNLNVVAQDSGQPVHLGSLAISVPTVIQNYGPQTLEPSDGILANDPYLGGVHLNDITLISPVHHDGNLFGYLACLAHHVDVGGGAPASIGAFKEVFQEGIIIPGVKLVTKGKIDNDVFRLVLSQIRSKRETAGDFRAQVAANNTGSRRLLFLIEREGPETVRFYMNELLDYTRRRTRASIAKLPQGSFSADGHVDNDAFTDRPVYVQAMVTIAEDHVDPNLLFVGTEFGVFFSIDSGKEWKQLKEHFIDLKLKFEVKPYTRFKNQVGEQSTMFIKDPSGNILEFKSFKNDNMIFESNTI